MHALAADLGTRLTGRTVERVEITAFSALKTFDPSVDQLAGQTVRGVTRHGKFLDIEVGDLHVVIHLARAGWIRWRDIAPPVARRRGGGPIAARLMLDGGSGFDVTEAGTKKSLAIWVVRQPDEVPRIAALGPDPLADDFTEARFADILSSAGRAQIKGVLRDQRRIAGVGNAYSDEILHAAKMSPFTPAAMPPETVHTLYRALRETLSEAVARSAGVAAADLKKEKKSHLRVHGRTGESCPVCGDTIRQVIYSDSTFQYCPTCQTGGKPLADRVLSRLLK